MLLMRVPSVVFRRSKNFRPISGFLVPTSYDTFFGIRQYFDELSYVLGEGRKHILSVPLVTTSNLKS